jgi:hypothetical protein
MRLSKSILLSFLALLHGIHGAPTNHALTKRSDIWKSANGGNLEITVSDRSTSHLSPSHLDPP